MWAEAFFLLLVENLLPAVLSASKNIRETTPSIQLNKNNMMTKQQLILLITVILNYSNNITAETK